MVLLAVEIELALVLVAKFGGKVPLDVVHLSQSFGHGDLAGL